MCPPVPTVRSKAFDKRRFDQESPHRDRSPRTLPPSVHTNSLDGHHGNRMTFAATPSGSPGRFSSPPLFSHSFCLLAEDKHLLLA